MAAAGVRANTRTELDDALSASRGVFGSVGIFSFFINALMLTVPLYMLQVYGRVLASRSEDTLLMLTILALGLLLTLGLVDLARSRILVRVGARFDNRLSDSVLSAMLVSRLRSQRTHGQPLRDLETIRTFLTGPGLLALFDAPWTPIFILVIFVLHPVLGFVALGGAVILFALAIVGELITRGPLREASKVSVNSHAFAESSLRNAEAIQAMGMMTGLLRRWLRRQETAIALQALASDRAGGVSASAKIVRQLLQIGMLGVGAYLAIRQVITPGVMVVASIIMARALAPVEVAINSWRSFLSARSAYARLQDLMAQWRPAQEPMKLPKPSGVLAVEGVVAAPPGATKAILKGVSFALSKGEMLGLIGPNAAGKSTLARLLVGVWEPAAGHIRLDGADVCRWNREQLGPHVGYLPQDVELFDGTVAENIARFHEQPAGDKVVAAAKRADVHEMILELPEGYDTPIGEGGSVLSAGQRQRIALARALYGDPVLIVLDEPNSNLDAEGEEALRTALTNLRAAGKTVVVIAHRPAIINAVDKLLVLRDGRVNMFGPPAEVLPSVTHAVVNTGEQSARRGTLDNQTTR
ncbi:type I secretion system permease/ATPase [Nitrococcus mobilis]|uniref:Type I secretion system ATPase, PrtD n=1 Tax=Nitrococcus mobilis Nb-231 TaxID=314278 RepID=A4BQQ6_9GAMM|nr:type I secretion system permease/ATPase [Nitrococcus mobilis]EAR21906.1 Type I secretion system ATPase, PrtD [Nitrococcus mobilis Nb-231]